jgi:hypothetical protein
MPVKKQPVTNNRRGDTSRTSSQGRKLSSGGELDKRGNPKVDADTKSVAAELKIRTGKPHR